MIRKGYVVTALISAVLGAGLVWFAAGDRQERVIDAWIPLNEEIASAISVRTATAAAEADNSLVEPGQAADTVKSGDGVVATEVKALPSPALDSGNDKAAPSAMGNAAQPSDGISINSAAPAELMEIPGIGEKKARAIIDYRTEHGPFQSVEDLTKVKGIGDKMLEKMKPHIRL